MLSVASLLNPVPTFGATRPFTSSYADRHSSVEYYPRPLETPSPSSNKKAKMIKDAPVFAKGKTKGEIRYPPFEEVDDETICWELKRLHLYPLGNITEYPRHIPYNSDKKGFLEKTGRESFEGPAKSRPGKLTETTDASVVFQYTFKVPGDESSYAVMWDYNIGLVRITPFFKCCKYSKVGSCPLLHTYTHADERFRQLQQRC